MKKFIFLFLFLIVLGSQLTAAPGVVSSNTLTIGLVGTMPVEYEFSVTPLEDINSGVSRGTGLLLPIATYVFMSNQIMGTTLGVEPIDDDFFYLEGSDNTRINYDLIICSVDNNGELIEKVTTQKADSIYVRAGATLNENDKGEIFAQLPIMSVEEQEALALRGGIKIIITIA